MQAHLPDLRQETGPTHNVAYQEENSLTRSLPRAILTFHHPGGQHFW